jgi:hypothetical protein
LPPDVPLQKVRSGLPVNRPANRESGGARRDGGGAKPVIDQIESSTLAENHEPR